jgi:hypothetical protein
MSSAALLRHDDAPSADHFAAKRIVICGSMAFASQMREIKGQLDILNVRAVVPDDVDGDLKHYDSQSYLAFKKAVSVSHINKIKDPRTYAVLVANFDKNGIYGYIGANSFAEVSVAFSSRKKIFLFSEIPSQYADELTAWGAIALNGDLSRLVRMYELSCRHATAQLRFPQF